MMEFPTPLLRYIRRTVSLPMSKQSGAELVLQQQWRVYDYETGRDVRSEWRDVPVVTLEEPEEESDEATTLSPSPTSSTS